MFRSKKPPAKLLLVKESGKALKRYRTVKATLFRCNVSTIKRIMATTCKLSFGELRVNSIIQRWKGPPRKVSAKDIPPSLYRFYFYYWSVTKSYCWTRKNIREWERGNNYRKLLINYIQQNLQSECGWLGWW